MSDQQTNDNQNSSSSNADGDGAEKKRRRRRRGKRRPDRENPEGSQDSQSASAESSTQESSSSTPDAESERKSDDDKGGDRKRRPNRRKKKEPRTDEEEASTSDDTVTATDNRDAKGSGDKEKKPEKTSRNGRPAKGEKKERPKRGSVLDRRKTRGETILDFPDEDDPIIPVAPAPIAKTVDAYIKHLRGWQREVVTGLRGIIKGQASEASEEILWSQPVYTLDGPVVYIKAFSDHVNLGFWRGNEIDDDSKRLVGEMPTMRHVTIRSVNEMDNSLFEDLVRQAFRLNKERGNPIK